MLKVIKKSQMLIKMEELLNLILNLSPLRHYVEEEFKSHNIQPITPQITTIMLQKHIMNSLCKTMGNLTLPSTPKIKIHKGIIIPNKPTNPLLNQEVMSIKATILNQGLVKISISNHNKMKLNTKDNIHNSLRITFQLLVKYL